MGIFTKKKKIKYPPGYLDATGYLKNILSGGTPDIPAREIEDLSAFQKLIVDQLGPMFENLMSSYGTARDELTKTVEGDYDPRTSDEYKGLREEAEWLGGKAKTSARQRANLGGMLQSGSAAGVEGQIDTQMNTGLLKILGSLFEKERERKYGAARELPGLDREVAGTAGQMADIADAERIIKQEQSDALYEAAMAEIMFPYTYMKGIASVLMGQQPIITGGGLTDLGFAAQTGASIFG